MMQTQFLKEVKHVGRFPHNASLSGQIISLAKTLANFGWLVHLKGQIKHILHVSFFRILY